MGDYESLEGTNLAIRTRSWLQRLPHDHSDNRGKISDVLNSPATIALLGRQRVGRTALAEALIQETGWRVLDHVSGHEVTTAKADVYLVVVAGEPGPMELTLCDRLRTLYGSGRVKTVLARADCYPEDGCPSWADAKVASVLTRADQISETQVEELRRCLRPVRNWSRERTQEWITHIVFSGDADEAVTATVTSLASLIGLPGAVTVAMSVANGSPCLEDTVLSLISRSGIRQLVNLLKVELSLDARLREVLENCAAEGWRRNQVERLLRVDV